MKNSVAQELNVLYSTMLDQWEGEKGDISRIKSLRPSQLPFCPVSFFVRVANHGAIRSMDMRGYFYTSIGTAVHEVLQRFMGQHGRLLADWKCKQCGKWNRLSHEHECCDFQMEYHEVGINYKGVIGHIDAIYRDHNKDYWILDFKTTSLASAKTKTKRPSKAYIEQVETYALFMWLQYKIRVKGVILMFVKRDKPIEPVFWSRELDSKDFKRIMKRTKLYLKMHREIMQLKTLDEALALRRHGRCVNPYCKVCKTTISHKSQITQAYKRGLKANRFPICDLQ